MRAQSNPSNLRLGVKTLQDLQKINFYFSIKFSKYYTEPTTGGYLIGPLIYHLTQYP